MNEQPTNRLDELFMTAREQTPEASYEETKKDFVAGLAAAGTSVGILAKWSALSIQTKAIVMLSTLGFISAATTAVVLIASSEEKTTPVIVPEERVRQFEKQDEHFIEIIENENDQKKYYNAYENNVVIWSDTDEFVFPQSPETPEVSDVFPDSPDFPEPSSVSDQKTITPFPSTPKTPDATKEIPPGDDDGMVVFTISDESTVEDFERIKQAATEAGVRFSYDVRVRKSKIRRCEISILLETKDGKRCRTTSKIKGSFANYTIGWLLGDDGKAVELISN